MPYRIKLQDILEKHANGHIVEIENIIPLNNEVLVKLFIGNVCYVIHDINPKKPVSDLIERVNSLNQKYHIHMFDPKDKLYEWTGCVEEDYKQAVSKLDEFYNRSTSI
ncbi:MAG: hypothetical protein PHF86_07020 [Candidatus Nanoarchaeia archaeon]|nr:hypothetical protein [Candidatus Nanoarchaeia archaeon]